MCAYCIKPTFPLSGEESLYNRFGVELIWVYSFSLIFPLKPTQLQS